MRKLLPRMNTDEDAEKLLEKDMSEYLHDGNFKLVTFVFKKK